MNAYDLVVVSKELSVPERLAARPDVLLDLPVDTSPALFSAQSEQV